MAASASAARVTRYQASLRSPHNALHSPSILYIIGASAAKPHMDGTSGIFHILYIIYYILYIIDVRETALILRWRRTAHRLTAHAHRCVKLQGQSILKVRKGMQAKSKR